MDARTKKDEGADYSAAHIEPKNWTHLRKVMGWERYASPRALAAMNAFYAGPWRTMMNVFQPCIKLQKKIRKGSRLIRQYDVPQTPLDRVLRAKLPRAQALAPLEHARANCDPFELAKAIEQQIEAIWALANPRHSPGATTR